MNNARMISLVKETTERLTGKVIGETEIQQAINNVHKQFTHKTGLLSGVAHISTEAGVQRYDVPPAMIQPTRVTYNRVKIEPATDADLDRRNNDGTWFSPFGDVGDPTFTGSGTNDMTTGGNFTGEIDTIYVVTIDGDSDPDSFSWTKAGVSQETGVVITTVAQTLDSGVTITFSQVDDHTIGELWTFTATVTPSKSSNTWTVE